MEKENNIDEYLKVNCLLDINNHRIQDLIRTNGWNDLEEKAKIFQIYNFVRHIMNNIVKE